MGLSVTTMGPPEWRDHRLHDATLRVVSDATARIDELTNGADINLALFPTRNLVDIRWPVSGMCHNTHAVE